MNTTTVISEDIQLAKELYIALGSTAGGSGSKSDPLRAVNGRIDPLVPSFGPSCKVHLASGEYLTNGFMVPRDFILLGPGKYSAILKLEDNCTSNFGFPAVKMLADNGWSNLFICKDLTLDCNWNGQPVATAGNNYKLDAIVVQCIRGKVESVRVMNFGANGKAYGTLGLECFPLSLWTVSNGDPFQYDPIYNGKKGTEDQTYLEISECEVIQPHFVYGGYCSAIFVKTSYPQAGDRQPMGVRTSRAATVKNNYVNVPGGIAYGSAQSEMVVFEGNIARDSKCGFNLDTGAADRISILGNQFLNCSQGISFVPENGGNKITIDDNLFLMGQKFFNPILQQYENWYAVNASRLTGSSANRNTVIGPDDPLLYFLGSGITGFGNVRIPIGGVTNQADIDALKATVATLNNQLASAISTSAALRSAIAVQKNIVESGNANLWKAAGL